MYTKVCCFFLYLKCSCQSKHWPVKACNKWKFKLYFVKCFFFSFSFSLDMTGNSIYLWIDGFSHSGASCTHDFAGLNSPYNIFLLIKWNQKLQNCLLCDVQCSVTLIVITTEIIFSVQPMCSHPAVNFRFVIRAKIYIASI